MLKKIGLVAVTTIGLSLAATPAFAAPAALADHPVSVATPDTVPNPIPAIPFLLIAGGTDLGRGLGELVAGIVLTPALIVHGLTCGDAPM